MTLTCRHHVTLITRTILLSHTDLSISLNLSKSPSSHVKGVTLVDVTQRAFDSPYSNIWRERRRAEGGEREREGRGRGRGRKRKVHMSIMREGHISMNLLPPCCLLLIKVLAIFLSPFWSSLPGPLHLRPTRGREGGRG